MDDLADDERPHVPPLLVNTEWLRYPGHALGAHVADQAPNGGGLRLAALPNRGTHPHRTAHVATAQCLFVLDASFLIEAMRSKALYSAQTLVLSHPGDPLHPLRSGELIRDSITGASLRVGSAEHWKQHPEAFCELAATFVKSGSLAEMETR